jgi:prepilin-type N-terminal cleavage/methylation domain-containing protein
VLASRAARRPSTQQGFSLIELAVVLLILGLMVGAVIRPIVSDGENRIMNETRTVLEEAREALLAYVAATGYLPCPADAASNGAESAGTDLTHATGACGTWHGFLPARVLGVTSVDAQGYAVDGGRQPHNRIRYAVSNDTIAGITNPFTRVNGVRRVGSALAEAENLLYVCGSGVPVNAGVDCGLAGMTLTSRAVVVIWSVGGNALSGGGNADEAENPNPNGGSADRIFVSRARSVATGAEFDDLLYWIPTTLLVNRMIAYGQLP